MYGTLNGLCRTRGRHPSRLFSSPSRFQKPLVVAVEARSVTADDAVDRYEDAVVFGRHHSNNDRIAVVVRAAGRELPS